MNPSSRALKYQQRSESPNRNQQRSGPPAKQHRSGSPTKQQQQPQYVSNYRNNQPSQQPQYQQKSNYGHTSIPVTSKNTSFAADSAYTSSAMSEYNLRNGFIKKVLFILMVQLSISTVAIGVTFIDKSAIRTFMVQNRWLMWVALAVSFVSMIVLVCKRDAFRKVPMNYILLFIYTISMSYLLAAIAATTESDVVLFALGFTVLIVLAVSLYACFTKTDVTKKGSIISGLFMVALLVLIFALCFRSRFLSVVYSGLIGIIFTIVLAYDIQKLIGKYELQYSLDEYIMASLDLYVDIVQIFLAILSVRRGSDSN